MTRCPRCQRRFPPNGECPAHGRPTLAGESLNIDVPPDIHPPEGWALGKLLATGGTAAVYELLGPSRAVMKCARFRDHDIRGRFEVEAEVLRTVGPPSTPRLIDSGLMNGSPYIVMEYISGETLAVWMSRNGQKGSFGEIVAFLTRLCISIDALHKAGYVHRDLKPENVIISKTGARLLDFGLAKRLVGQSGTNITQIGTVVGTPHYMAPEQISMAGLVDHRADIYSLGVIAFEMLSGGPPFIGERRAIEYQHQVGRPPSIREIREIPRSLDDLVLRCLSKRPDTRPSSGSELLEELNRALTKDGTLRGVGGTSPSQASSTTAKSAGRQTEIAIAWIVGGDPITTTRAISEVQGIVVRQRGDGILAGFTPSENEPSVMVALGACRSLAREHCRIVIHHAANALVRRSREGKLMVYGKELESLEAWIPTTPFVGLVLTNAAAERAKVPCTPASDLPNFQRERSANANTPEADHRPTFVGRKSLVLRICTALANPTLVAISGEPGAGKSRLLDEIVLKLRASSVPVLHARARRRFLGDRPDDDRVAQALGDRNLADALATQASRRAIIVIDDVDRLSPRALDILLAPQPITRIVTSPHPIVEVADDDTATFAIQLPPLSHDDAASLLREQLRPARLIPDALIERLVLRGTGSPGLLVALAQDVKTRGALRQSAGSDDWYVVPDELDTMLAAPDVSWVAHQTLDMLPSEVATLLRMASGLGPRFTAAELAHVTQSSMVPGGLAFLQRRALVVERNGWFEMESASLQESIYHHLLDERELVHHRALEYWAEQGVCNPLGHLARIAFHAAGCYRDVQAAASWIALARAATHRGELDQSELLLSRAMAALSPSLQAPVLAAIEAAEDE